MVKRDKYNIKCINIQPKNYLVFLNKDYYSREIKEIKAAIAIYSKLCKT